MKKPVLALAWLVLAAIGVVGVYQRLTTGHELAAYGSYIPWGLWVASYIYFIGLSAGAFLLSAVVYIGQVKLLKPLGPLALFTALCTLIMALVSIWFDLGHMFRAWEVMLRPNFRSMMAWMVWLYTAYFGLLTVETVLAMVEPTRPWVKLSGPRGAIARALTRIPVPTAQVWVRRLALIGVPLAIAFHGGVGALFGTVGAQPFWHSSLVPILFLTGALVSGAALLLAIYWLVWPKRDEQFKATTRLLSQILLGLLCFDIILEWAEFSIPLWNSNSQEVAVFAAITTGPYWWNFWIVHLLLGTLIPLGLLLTQRKRPAALALAGALIALTFLSVRLNIVIPPLTFPQIQGLQEAYVSPHLQFNYLPSSFEWMIVAFVVALGSAVFAIGTAVLPLLPSTDPGDGDVAKEARHV
ncbi:MAG: polysulfide reductase NrfD [Oligoflexia bacterium]|nr:polysulfide reductase NrfD [Oligoflexia bacterium]